MMPSTTEALLDVNVLIAAVFEDHPDHAKANAFLASLEHFYTCPTTQGGFLRFATRPWKNTRGQEQAPRLSMLNAQTTLKSVIASYGHVFLPDDIAFIDLPMRSMSGHKQWTDAYLLRLARRHSLRLASLESRMSNLDDPGNPALFLVS
jgi:toxin-antitoxin system PIN domain toxin